MLGFTCPVSAFYMEDRERKMQRNRIRAGIKDTYVDTLVFVTYQLKLYYCLLLQRNGQNSLIDLAVKQY